MEVVRDPAVINAYVKKRQAIEEENTTTDALAPTGDAEKDKRAKKRCVPPCSLIGHAVRSDNSLCSVADWKKRLRG